MDENRKQIELYDALCRLLPAQFAEVLLRLGIEDRFLSAMSAPQSIRAREVIQLLEQSNTEGLSLLSQFINEISWSSKYSKSEEVTKITIASKQDSANPNALPPAIETQNNLIAIGPDLISIGEIDGTHGKKWIIKLQQPFLVGDISNLIRFGSDFETIDDSDKYILLGNLGEGYELSMPPKWQKSGIHLILEVDGHARAPRINVNQLKNDVALVERPNGKYSMDVLAGNPRMVSGVERIPQLLMMTLSQPKGSWYMQPESGSRVAEYYERFSMSVHLADMINLEIIRLAFIPLYDPIQKQKYIPFDFIERVRGLRILPEQPHPGWLEAELTLDLSGFKEPWRSKIRFSVKNVGVR